jgi:enamine deaminase RidA (YjgF/YER057c/UK114 family)
LDGHFDWLVTGHWQFYCNSNAEFPVIINNNCRKTEMYMPAETVPSRDPTQPCAAPAHIRRQHGDGLDLVAVESPPVTELHLTVTPMKGESISAMAKRLADALNPWDATVVRQIVFGSAAAYQATLKTLRQVLDDPELPVAWVEGTGCGDHATAGIQTHAIAGARVRTLSGNGRPLARTWEDAVATHCMLNSILPTRTQATAPEQAREVFEKLQTGLASAGMTMKDLVRTWFYLNDLLSWYGDFNRVRNDVFAHNELRPPSLPASTGVGGRNPMGAALAAAAWAVRPHDPAAEVLHFAPSPEQCPASSYGSAFSRAVEIGCAGFRRLLVSGTASIARDGKTEHVGDGRAQIERSMQVVEAILESRRMTFADTAFATAFFKHPADAPLFADWLARHGLQSMPVVSACCDICRDNLLFEIELEAVQADG